MNTSLLRQLLVHIILGLQLFIQAGFDENNRQLPETSGTGMEQIASLIDKCPENYEIDVIKNLCDSNLTVFEKIPITDGYGRLFRNIFCGFCHISSVSLFSKHIIICDGSTKYGQACRLVTPVSNTQLQFDDPDTNVMIEANLLNGYVAIQNRIPSLVVLLNFGFDGKKNIMFPTTEVKPICKENEIYDYVNQACRSIFCAEGYQESGGLCKKVVSLVKPDVTCPIDPEINDIQKGCIDQMEDPFIETQTSEPYGIDITISVNAPRNLYEKFQSLSEEYKIDFIKGLLLNFTLQPDDKTDVFIENLSFAAREDVSVSPCMRYSITPIDDDDIEINQNHTFDFLKDSVHRMIKFTVSGKGKKINSKVMKKIISIYGNLRKGICYALGVEKSMIVITDLLSLHVEMKSSFNVWCKNDLKAFYQFPDFTISTGTDGLETFDDITVYINVTETPYSMGGYDLTLQYSEKILINGNVVVCEKIPRIINKTCQRIALDKNEYIILKNRSILYNDEVVSTEQYEYHHDRVHICRIATNQKEIFKKNFVCEKGYSQIMEVQSTLTLILMSLSLFCIFLLILFYLCSPHMKNIHGHNMFCLSVSIFLSQFIFLTFGSNLFQVGATWCKVVAIGLHYLFLSLFFWMNVIAFDLYRMFGTSSVTFMSDCNKKLLWYNVYGWGMPSLIICLSVLMDSLDIVDMSYGKFMDDTNANTSVIKEFDMDGLICWINNPLANLIAFGLPSMIIFCANLGFFIVTMRNLRRKLNNKMLKQSSIESETSMTSHNREISPYKLTGIYFRMLTIMGLTWVFFYLGALFSTFTFESYIMCYVLHATSFLFIIFNASQGMFIFIPFVCNKQNKQFLQNKMNSFRNSVTRTATDPHIP